MTVLPTQIVALYFGLQGGELGFDEPRHGRTGTLRQLLNSRTMRMKEAGILLHIPANLEQIGRDLPPPPGEQNPTV